MDIALLAGARPNYMKVFPIRQELTRRGGAVCPMLIHSGQHYDALMNDVFFTDFGMAPPDHFLGIGSGLHGAQTARTMIAIEELFTAQRPDLLVVVGDVNSTLAGALVATKMGVPVAHVEAGLRSGDRTMPEEINRLATDAVCDLLLTSCRDADENLRREGVSEDRIRFVGNVMIDSLVQLLPRARASAILDTLQLQAGAYALVTLHRPSNVDDRVRLKLLLGQLAELGERLPVLFPLHPRTRKLVDQDTELTALAARLRCAEPMGYIDFLKTQSEAAVVITDSGGIQEETSFLGVPCLTVRPNTERPVTVTEGTNRLIEPSVQSIPAAVQDALAARSALPPVIEGWDGHAAERIVASLGSLCRTGSR